MFEGVVTFKVIVAGALEKSIAEALKFLTFTISDLFVLEQPVTVGAMKVVTPMSSVDTVGKRMLLL